MQSNILFVTADNPDKDQFLKKDSGAGLCIVNFFVMRKNEKKTSYTNDLHDALLLKNGKRFWSCWSSKFESSVSCFQVDGCVDECVIVGKFAESFQSFTHTCTIIKVNQSFSWISMFVTSYTSWL